MISLSKFCKDRSIPKTTAHTRLQDAGFDTSRGLSVEAQAFLMQEFGKVQARVEVLPEPESESLPGPDLGGAINVASLPGFGGGGGQMSLYDDELAAAMQAIQTLKQIGAAVQGSNNALYADIQQTRGVSALLKKQAHQTQMDIAVGAMENRLLQRLKVDANQELKAEVEAVQAHLHQPSNQSPES